MLKFVATSLLLMLVVLGNIQGFQTSMAETPYEARFRPLIPSLKRKVDVLIRLPQTLKPFETNREAQLYLSIETNETNVYEIRIENDKGCTGANACFLGSISGQLRTDENKDNLDAIINEGKVVRLANGLRGYYFEGPCGASCVPDSLLWQQEGIFYIVTMNGGGVSKMMQVANSMILSSPINL